MRFKRLFGFWYFEPKRRIFWFCQADLGRHSRLFREKSAQSHSYLGPFISSTRVKTSLGRKLNTQTASKQKANQKLVREVWGK